MGPEFEVEYLKYIFMLQYNYKSSCLSSSFPRIQCREPPNHLGDYAPGTCNELMKFMTSIGTMATEECVMNNDITCTLSTYHYRHGCTFTASYHVTHHRIHEHEHHGMSYDTKTCIASYHNNYYDTSVAEILGGGGGMPSHSF